VYGLWGLLVVIVRRTRYGVDSLSHPLPDGSRFALETTTPQIEAQLRRGQARFEAAVATFLGVYPAQRATMAGEWEAAEAAAWQTAGRPGDSGAFVDTFLAAGRVRGASGREWFFGRVVRWAGPRRLRGTTRHDSGDGGGASRREQCVRAGAGNRRRIRAAGS
jgi:hypothetical protein